MAARMNRDKTFPRSEFPGGGEGANQAGNTVTIARYQPGATGIPDEGYQRLEDVIRRLNEQAEDRVAITGYCDPEEVTRSDTDIAERRVREVLDYLQSRGVDAGRISHSVVGASGKGQNKTTMVSALLRRVDATFLPASVEEHRAAG